MTVGSSYNVREFGAIGDGAVLDHLAIQRAINTAAAHGGGTIDGNGAVFYAGQDVLGRAVYAPREWRPGATLMLLDCSMVPTRWRRSSAGGRTRRARRRWQGPVLPVGINNLVFSGVSIASRRGNDLVGSDASPLRDRVFREVRFASIGEWKNGAGIPAGQCTCMIPQTKMPAPSRRVAMAYADGGDAALECRSSARQTGCKMACPVGLACGARHSSRPVGISGSLGNGGIALTRGLLP